MTNCTSQKDQSIQRDATTPISNFRDPTQGVSLMTLVRNVPKKQSTAQGYSSLQASLPSLQNSLSSMIILDEEEREPRREDFGSQEEFLLALLNHCFDTLADGPFNFEDDQDWPVPGNGNQ